MSPIAVNLKSRTTISGVPRMSIHNTCRKSGKVSARRSITSTTTAPLLDSLSLKRSFVMRMWIDKAAHVRVWDPVANMRNDITALPKVSSKDRATWYRKFQPEIILSEINFCNPTDIWQFFPHQCFLLVPAIHVALKVDGVDEGRYPRLQERNHHWRIPQQQSNQVNAWGKNR